MSESGEKTFAPSAKRKQDAARKGDVLRSRELASAITMLFGAGWLAFAGPWLIDTLATLARGGLNFGRREIDDFRPGTLLLDGLVALLPPILSLAIPVALLVTISQLAPGGEGRWVSSNIAFKGSRVSPLSGVKRMFGPNGLIELGKGLLKIALLGAIAWGWGRQWMETLASMGGSALAGQLASGWGAITSLLFALSGGLVLIALVDFPVQAMRRNQRLKMSMQDMRDEQKEAEGSPEARAQLSHWLETYLATGTPEVIDPYVTLGVKKP